MILDEQRDPAGAALREAWARTEGYWYDDDEEDDDDEAFDAALERVEPLTVVLVEIIIGVVRDMHRSGAVDRIVGRPVPVLIHKLEYHDEIVAQNVAAHPPDLVDTSSAGSRPSTASRISLSG